MNKKNFDNIDKPNQKFSFPWCLSVIAEINKFELPMRPTFYMQQCSEYSHASVFKWLLIVNFKELKSLLGFIAIQ